MPTLSLWMSAGHGGGSNVLFPAMVLLNLIHGQKLCKACGKFKPTAEFYTRLVGSKSYLRSDCKSCSVARLAAWGETNAGEIYRYQRNYRMGLRNKVLEKYGARCANPNCLVPGGCTDVRALQLDHVNNDGACERSTVVDQMGPNDPRRWRPRTNRDAIWKKALLDESGRYQLLCANCNVIKEHDRLKQLVAERNVHRLGAIYAA